MKVRIKGQSIRLRLTQSEVRLFGEKGILTETIRFGPGEAQAIHFKMTRSGDHEICCAMEGNNAMIHIPEMIANRWVASEEVGLQNTFNFGDEEISILIEKDFTCLIERDGGEDDDTFSNPMA